MKPKHRTTVEIDYEVYEKAVKLGFDRQFGKLLEEALRNKVSGGKEEEKEPCCQICGTKHSLQYLKKGILCNQCFQLDENREVVKSLIT